MIPEDPDSNDFCELKVWMAWLGGSEGGTCVHSPCIEKDLAFLVQNGHFANWPGSTGASPLGIGGSFIGRLLVMNL